MKTTALRLKMLLLLALLLVSIPFIYRKYNRIINDPFPLPDNSQVTVFTSDKDKTLQTVQAIEHFPAPRQLTFVTAEYTSAVYSDQVNPNFLFNLRPSSNQHLFIQEDFAHTYLLVDSHWSRALLIHIYNSLQPAQSLFIPLERAKAKQGKSGLLSPLRTDKLTTLFQQQGTFYRFAGKPYLRIERQQTLTPPLAGLNFVLANHKAIFQALYDGLAVTDQLRRQFSNEITYTTTSAGAKAPMIAKIIQSQLATDRPLRHLDVGGGYGLLAKEVAIILPQIVQSDVTDIVSEYAGLHQGLFAANHH